MKKTEEEIKKLEIASKIADDCFEYICEKIKIGMSEKEVATLMDEYMLANGAESLSFDTIVGSGVNSAQIHSTPTDKKIENGDIVLLDFGCKYQGYCSDISRTIFIGDITDEQKEIYNIVLNSQVIAVERITSGILCSEADKISRDIIKNKGYDFAHALGHGVGKEVHESPVISYKNEEDILENNMVFTIEPGIYIENKFGIRIEDTVVLENGKVRVLNKVTKDIIIIKGE